MRPKFSLAFLLMLVVPGVWVSVQIHDWLDTQPIKMHEFTWTEMEQQLKEGKTVLLFCHPTYAVGESWKFPQCSDRRLRRSFREGNFEARLLRYDDWSGKEINRIFVEFGHTKYPMVILFRPDREPELIDHLEINHWFDGRIRKPAGSRYRKMLGILSLMVVVVFIAGQIRSAMVRSGSTTI